ncbi:Bifunctional ligase/repressor BirA [Planctomycetes bacterium CA13]|uniref:Bifunctional ligase/repressor BirA n=1 Tax=Novipirellula herctigrandis TaxID=2527986 RepID=A0A5C5Z127_9BACT|nr:Bifunctional ligase/repressor BirA [Planctomycetes bacterium CA13]
MIQTTGSLDPTGLLVAEHILEQRLCGSVSYCEESASTNSDALGDLRKQAISNDQLPRLYLADRQTSGRGRQGNSWLSGADSLTFSLTIDFDSVREPSAKLLSLAAGVATARAIEFEFAPVKTMLKWPNDVYLSGGKLAGILIETSQAFSDRLVIGIGMNVNDSPTLDSYEVGAKPNSLYAVTGRRSTRYSLLEPIVASLVKTVDQLRQSPSIILGEFRQRCFLTGKQIRFNQLGQDCQGYCRGIADDGELMIQTSQGLRLCDSGAIRMVRVQ